MAELGTDVQETVVDAPADETVVKPAEQGEVAEQGELTDEQKAAAAASAEVSDEEKKKRREGFERRQERKRLRELELENAKLQGFREGLERGKGSVTEPPAEPVISRPVRPKEADFPTHEEYEAAMDKYEDQSFEYRAHVKIQERRAEEERSSRTAAEQALRDTVKRQIEEGRKKYEDFDEVVTYNEELQTTPLMVQAVAKRTNAHDIQYYLGSNPAEAARLASIKDPIELVAEIGEISATLKAKATSAAPTKTTTKAPAPPSTVRGKAAPSTDTTLTGKSQAERVALIEAAARKRRMERR